MIRRDDRKGQTIITVGDGNTAIGAHSTSGKHYITFRHMHYKEKIGAIVELDSLPEVIIEIESIAGLEILLRKLTEVKGIMENRGYSKVC